MCKTVCTMSLLLLFILYRGYFFLMPVLAIFSEQLIKAIFDTEKLMS